MRKEITKDQYKTLAVLTTVVSALLAFFTLYFVLLAAYVPSGSMLPTFQLGDIAISYKLNAAENILSFSNRAQKQTKVLFRDAPHHTSNVLLDFLEIPSRFLAEYCM